MSSYIAQISDGTNTVPVGSSLYGTCATAAGTAAKVVTMPNFDTLITGVTIHVKFTNSNTVANPTLNVNSTGAKAIMRYGTTRPSTTVATSWNSGAVVSFTYDGTYWQMNDYGYEYSLPIATASVLGGIKSGGSLNVNSDATTQVKFYDKGISANVDKLAMGCIDEFGHNKLAFLGAQYISVEYSTNAGSTWTDYGATDAQKIAAVTTSGSGFVVGKKSANNVTVNDQVRMTLQAAQSGSNRIYTAADQLLINITTNGCGGCKAKIETLTIGNVINNVDSWVTLGTYDIGGWSGWNSIPCQITFGGNSTQTSQIGKLRITLTLSSLSTTSANTLQIIDVRLIGHTNWSTPSELARAGRLYTIDTAQNATFPAKITATGGFSGNLTGNATSATTATTATKLSTSSAGSASQPVYFANGIPVAGNSIPSASSTTPSDVGATAAVGTGTTWARADHKHKLPIASSSTLGGFKVGSGLSIGSDGVLNVTGGGVADAVEWDNVLHKPTTIDGYGITDAPTIVKFTLSSTSVTSTKTPSQLATAFTGDGYVLAKLYNSADSSYESLDKITCNASTITFSTIYQNTLGGGFKYKKVIGNRTNNTWTYEIS